MKKKLNKKLNLGKIQIANLNPADQSALNGGLQHVKPIEDFLTTTSPTRLTRCYICPVPDSDIS
ncbi:class I lanthipeptide [Chitinophaga nivalis]|uniref:Class I lanthipeptide n=1 Tax=Chitinophaga nivalis TaxID=2991709 RepID=A0ABT3IJC1_9BACT|nr:class I lanthipeptide [Chitinophaga nivalis]MCW3466270.1 class I lanthipeptide [Chitinophaga nivalis]MCW3484039.1 class I lanthipeptide [Chitinophaga nivalis]